MVTTALSINYLSLFLLLLCFFFTVCWFFGILLKNYKLIFQLIYLTFIWIIMLGIYAVYICLEPHSKSNNKKKVVLEWICYLNSKKIVRRNCRSRAIRIVRKSQSIANCKITSNDLFFPFSGKFTSFHYWFFSASVKL